MYYCAIDPGKNAAIALITGPRSVLTVACNKNIRDAFDLLLSLKDHECIIGIEQVHAIWGASSKSTFSFGQSHGYWIGILAYLGLSWVDIPIKEWQAATTERPIKPKTNGLSASEKRKVSQTHKDTLKMESFRAASVAFPSNRFPSHDVADAVNMARFLRIKHQRLAKETTV